MADAHFLQMTRVFLTVNSPLCDHSSATDACLADAMSRTSPLATASPSSLARLTCPHAIRRCSARSLPRCEVQPRLRASGGELCQVRLLGEQSDAC